MSKSAEEQAFELTLDELIKEIQDEYNLWLKEEIKNTRFEVLLLELMRRFKIYQSFRDKKDVI